MLAEKNSQAINLVNLNVFDNKNDSFNDKKSPDFKSGFFLLSKASEYCSYSQEYLSLLARRGELKSKKIGRNWYTTLEWLQEYINKHKEGTGGHNKGKMFLGDSFLAGAGGAMGVELADRWSGESFGLIRKIKKVEDLLKEGFKEIFTFERVTRPGQKTERKEAATVNGVVNLAMKKKVNLKSSGQLSTAESILAKQEAIGEIIKRAESAWRETTRLYPGDQRVAASAENFYVRLEDMGILASGEGQGEYFNLEPEIDWWSYWSESWHNILAVNFYRGKLFITEGIHRIKLFFKNWDLYTELEKRRFVLAGVSMAICLFFGGVAFGGAIEGEKIWQSAGITIQKAGVDIDQSLALAADMYAEKIKKREKKLFLSEPDKASLANEKLIAGVQTTRTQFLEPGEERIQLGEEREWPALDDEIATTVDKGRWIEKIWERTLLVFDKLMVIKRDQVSRYYQVGKKDNSFVEWQEENLYQKTPDAENGPLVGSQVDQKQDENNFYEDKIKGRKNIELGKENWLQERTVPPGAEDLTIEEGWYFSWPLEEPSKGQIINN